MPAEAYPRHAAERMRAARRAEAEQALARAQATREAAQGRLEQAEAELCQQCAVAPAPPAEASGAIAALALQRIAAYAERHATRTRVLEQQVREARAHMAACAAAVDAARAALAEARAGERVIERDRERFERGQRRAREHGEQLEVEERLDAARDRRDLPE